MELKRLFAYANQEIVVACEDAESQLDDIINRRIFRNSLIIQEDVLLDITSGLDSVVCCSYSNTVIIASKGDTKVPIECFGDLEGLIIKYGNRAGSVSILNKTLTTKSVNIKLKNPEDNLDNINMNVIRSYINFNANDRIRVSKPKDYDSYKGDKLRAETWDMLAANKHIDTVTFNYICEVKLDAQKIGNVTNNMTHIVTTNLLKLCDNIQFKSIPLLIITLEDDDGKQYEFDKVGLFEATTNGDDDGRKLPIPLTGNRGPISRDKSCVKICRLNQIVGVEHILFVKGLESDNDKSPNIVVKIVAAVDYKK